MVAEQHVEVAGHQAHLQQQAAIRRGSAPAARPASTAPRRRPGARDALAEEQRAGAPASRPAVLAATSVTLIGVEVFSARYCKAL
jgi:hypothetical protein